MLCSLERINTTQGNIHCVESVCIRSYSGPFFLVFGLNKERCRVSFRIYFECGKIRTTIIQNMDTYHAVTKAILTGDMTKC